MISPTDSPPSQSHSLEVERRLTLIEVGQERVQQKMALHEKSILGLYSVVYVIAQDKFPGIASFIRGLLIP